MVGEIKSFRQELMGVATIMILLGHTIFYGVDYVDYGFLQDIVTLGYSGVDIFLFLSGFGLTFSILNNSKKVFYYHRLYRLLPSFVGIWLLYILFNYKTLSLSTLFAPICKTINGRYWYIGFITIAYICFPYIHGFTKDRKGWSVILVALLFSFVALIPFIIQGTAVSCNAKVCIITRIPIFILGMLFAMGKVNLLNKMKMNAILLIIGVLFLYPFYLNNDLGGNKYFTTYYCIFFLTPPLLYIYCRLFCIFGGAFYLNG